MLDFRWVSDILSYFFLPIFSWSFIKCFNLQVDISAICKQGDVADMLFAITFTLLSGIYELKSWRITIIVVCLTFVGNIRRFRRICEHIQSQVCSKRFPGPSSPPGLSSVTTAVSESSSCGSDSSERISCYKRQVRRHYCPMFSVD